MNKLTPLEDRILVKPIKKSDIEKTDGGIFIPDVVKKDVSEGEVISVGNGRYAIETGVFIPNYLYPGDKVLFGSQQGMPVDVGGEELRIMRESDVLLLIERKKTNEVLEN